jgi:hypothetical protein
MQTYPTDLTENQITILETLLPTLEPHPRRSGAKSTLGLVLKAHVTPANVQETDGGRDLLERLQGEFPRLKHLWVDQGFRDWLFGCWVVVQ